MFAKTLNRLSPVKSLGHHQHVRLMSNDSGKAFVQQRVIVNAENANLFCLAHAPTRSPGASYMYLLHTDALLKHQRKPPLTEVGPKNMKRKVRNKFSANRGEASRCSPSSVDPITRQRDASQECSRTAVERIPHLRVVLLPLSRYAGSALRFRAVTRRPVQKWRAETLPLEPQHRDRCASNSRSVPVATQRQAATTYPPGHASANSHWPGQVHSYELLLQD